MLKRQKAPFSIRFDYHLLFFLLYNAPSVNLSIYTSIQPLPLRNSPIIFSTRNTSFACVDFFCVFKTVGIRLPHSYVTLFFLVSNLLTHQLTRTPMHRFIFLVLLPIPVVW